MSERQINELLTEWATCAPSEIGRGAINWYLDCSPIDFVVSGQSLRDLDAIQGAVQRALDKRGAAWSIRASVEDGNCKTAMIDTSPGVSISMTGENPAIVLLQAYLQALKIWAETKTAPGLPAGAEFL